MLSDYLDRHEDGIAAFRALIESDANDATPTGNLLFPFRNYRFHAFRMIALAELALERYDKALNAVATARVVYCEFSKSSEEADMARLDRLDKKIREHQKPK